MIANATRIVGVALLALMLAQTARANEAAESCVYARDVKRVEILNDEMVLVHGRFDRFWLNRLGSRCVGLRKNMVLYITRHGSQMCANDSFGARARDAFIDDGPTARCRLGSFEEVVVEQISALRQSLRES